MSVTGLEVAQVVLQSITALGTLVVLVMIVRTHRATLENQRLLRRSDLQMECNRRFDRIMDMRDKLEAADGELREVKAFYKRFWELQSDQYQFWINGWVTDEDMFCWVQWRHGEWVENPVLGKDEYSFRQSWHDSRERYMEPGFAEFMDQVFSQGARVAMDDARRRLEARHRQPQ